MTFADLLGVIVNDRDGCINFKMLRSKNTHIV